jgi:hypothetical protein
MRPYYTIDHRRAWLRIQATHKSDPERGLRMAAAFGRKLAVRDMRRESKRATKLSPSTYSLESVAKPVDI